MSSLGSNVRTEFNHYERRIWQLVAESPLGSLWRLQGISIRNVIRHSWRSILEDGIFGHAAELAFYFLFALFPTLFSASSILGLAARSATKIYDRLLDYLGLVIPADALGTVMQTFNETTAAATSGKVTFGLIAALWSASVGISAVQSTLNAVYKIQDSRSYIVARIYAIGLTFVITVIVSLCLASMLGGDFVAHILKMKIPDPIAGTITAVAARLVGWGMATLLLALSFAVTYYWAPDRKKRRWHWITPGAAVGMAGWLIASLGLRIYLYFFNSFSVTYGSLGAVIILLLWFYITGLMLLVGAEINSEIEAAVAARRMAQVPAELESLVRREPASPASAA